eukprot:jgi/Bigna1/140219/aug1.54_g14927
MEDQLVKTTSLELEEETNENGDDDGLTDQDIIQHLRSRVANIEPYMLFYQRRDGICFSGTEGNLNCERFTR